MRNVKPFIDSLLMQVVLCQPNAVLGLLQIGLVNFLHGATILLKEKKIEATSFHSIPMVRHDRGNIIFFFSGNG